MYLVGAPHSNKEKALEWIERLLSERRRLVTTAEVFQEILHRYSALKRREYIDVAFQALKEVVEEVFPITAEDVFEAKQILTHSDACSSRDCLHVASMRRQNIFEILSFNKVFDGFPGMTRYPGK